MKEHDMLNYNYSSTMDTFIIYTHLNIFLKVSGFISNIHRYLLAAHQLCLFLHDRGER